MNYVIRTRRKKQKDRPNCRKRLLEYEGKGIREGLRREGASQNQRNNRKHLAEGKGLGRVFRVKSFFIEIVMEK